MAEVKEVGYAENSWNSDFARGDVYHDELLRADALKKLTAVRGPSSVPLLIEGLASEDRVERTAEAEALLASYRTARGNMSIRSSLLRAWGSWAKTVRLTR